MNKYVFIFEVGGEVYTSRPVPAKDEDEAAEKLIDQVEMIEGQTCNIHAYFNESY